MPYNEGYQHKIYRFVAIIPSNFITLSSQRVDKYRKGCFLSPTPAPFTFRTLLRRTNSEETPYQPQEHQ